MVIKRKAIKIFSAEEQPMILRCSRRRFQTSNTRYEMRNATFYKSAFRAKKSRRASLPDDLSDKIVDASSILRHAVERHINLFQSSDLKIRASAPKSTFNSSSLSGGSNTVLVVVFSNVQYLACVVSLVQQMIHLICLSLSKWK